MASKRYHINEKGEPGLCKAMHNCRFGEGVYDHYPTPELAREAYEQHQGSALATHSNKVPEGFTAMGYVGPNGDIAIAEAYQDAVGNTIYRRAGSDDWQAVRKDGRLIQAATPSGRYENSREAAEAFGKAVGPNSKSIISNIEFEGSESNKTLRAEQLKTYLAQAEAAASPLEASKYYWYALGLKGTGRGQEALLNRFQTAVEDHEANWIDGKRFDTSIEGTISLTNKSGLATTFDVGFYSTRDGSYNVYRRGAGPAYSFAKSPKYGGWRVGSGPGSFSYIAKDKRVARKAAVVLHDLEVASRVGRWTSTLSKAEVETTLGKLIPLGGDADAAGRFARLIETIR